MSVDDDLSTRKTAKEQHDAVRRQIFDKRAELDQLRPQYSDLPEFTFSIYI